MKALSPFLLLHPSVKAQERMPVLVAPLPDARNPFAANARRILGIPWQFALQSCIFQIRSNDEHDANQGRGQERPEGTERKRYSDSQEGTR